MICGVTIGGENTLTKWGLMLCNDLSISPAEPRYKYADVPEMSGALDLTESLTGRVVYSQRKISFTLFAIHDRIANKNTPATEENFFWILSDLMAFCHGKRLTLRLPDNPDYEFVGRLSIGTKSGYNSGRVTVEMIADPFRLYKTQSTQTITANGNVIIQNDAMPSVPTFTATTSGATVTLGSVSHTLSAGDNTFMDIVLGNGNNTIAVSGLTTGASIVVTWQKGKL